MKLIAFEGIDGVGKTTAARDVAYHLNELGLHAVVANFPRYNVPTGKAITELLHNKDLLSSKLARAAIFAVNRRQGWSRDFHKYEFEDDDTIVIADRWIYSNVAYNAETIADANWIVDFEINKLDLPMPDLTFFLDGSPVETRTRDVPDSFERSPQMQRDAYEVYQFLASVGDWNVITVSNDDGHRAPFSIAREITDNIVEFFDFELPATKD